MAKSYIIIICLFGTSVSQSHQDFNPSPHTWKWEITYKL